MDIGVWLRGIGLGQYEASFHENAIEADILPDLSDEDLEKIGLPLGHRKRILKAISALPKPQESRLDDTVPATSGPERRQVTVLFSDLVGSTSLSASMDPEDFREVISKYQRCVGAVVDRHGGFVAKYMGDGVLVFFGYPVAHEDDAERSIRAGLEIVAQVSGLDALSRLQTRVGIATGLVVVGDLIGTGSATEQAIVGETPNLAARLQSLAEPSSVLLADSTRRLLGELFDLEDTGEHALKGIPLPARAWRALRARTVQSRFDAYHQAGLSRLVGREEELELILRRWSKAKEGRGQVVLLSGEAGIGKSRLTAGVTENLGVDACFDIRYFCSPQHAGSALFPVISQIEREAGFALDDGPEEKLAKLTQMLAPTAAEAEEIELLADMLSISAANQTHLTAQQRRQRTLLALNRRIVAISERKPVLVVLEDAHWMDPTTLEMLNQTVEQIRSARVMLVVTFRPEFVCPWTGQSHVTMLTLSRLGEREAMRLIASLTGETALSSDLLTEIVNRTDGIPLFLEEMTKALVEADGADAVTAVTASTFSAALGVPTSLQAPLMARLDRLGRAKPVVQTAAALGREFRYELLASVAALPAPALDAALDQLVGAGLLFRSGSGHEASFLFKHALIQDAAYGTLLRQPRRDLHTKIASVLTDKFPEIRDTQPEILAHHFYEAGLFRQSAQWRLQAGQRALRRSAFKEAVRQFGSGLAAADAIDHGLDPRLPIELQTGLGLSLTATSGYAAKETGEAFAKARLLCEKSNDPRALARVGYGQFLYFLMSGQVLKSEELAREILQLGEKLASLDVIVLGLRTLGVSLFELGRLAEARHTLEKAMSLLDAPGEAARAPGEAQVMILTWLSFVLLFQGHLDQARTMNEAAVKEARRSRSAHTQAFSMGFGVAISAETRAPDLLARAEALRALADEQDLDLHRGIGSMFVGVARMRAGDATGAGAFQSALGKYMETGARWALTNWLIFPAAELPDQHSERETAIQQAFDAVESTQERWYEAEVLRQQGELRRVRSDFEGAGRSYLAAIRTAEEQGSMLHKLRASVSLANLLRQQGRGQEGRQMLLPVVQWFAKQSEVPVLRDAREILGTM